MKNLMILLLAGALMCLSSCASSPPSEGYQKCKSALVDSIAKDIQGGGE